MESTRRLAAIMFADIVGYTAMMGQNEARAFQALSQLKVIAAPLVQQYNGRWHKDLGDGALCSFGSAFDAVKSAIEIQQQLNKEAEFKVRIGIHSGDVTFKDGDVFGDGVNIASRVQSEAAPGGICLSESVYKTVRNKQGIELTYLGKRKFKNVEEPARLYQVSAQGIATIERTPTRVISLRKALVLAIGLTAISSMLLVWYFKGTGTLQSPQVERYDILLPAESPLALIGSADFGIGQPALALSPKEDLLVFAGQEDLTTRLFFRPLGSYAIRVIEGTEGAYFPFFSPDGEWIGFFSKKYLKKVSIKGGEPTALCEVSNPRGAVWTSDDRIIFSMNQGRSLVWVHSDSNQLHHFQIEGSSTTVGSLEYPSVAGDHHILISSPTTGGINSVSLKTGQPSDLLDRGGRPVLLPSGHLSFVEFGRLKVAPFDLKAMKVTGEIVSIIDDLRTERGAGQITFSNQGTLAYVPGISAMESEFVLRSLNGEEERLPMASGYFGQFRLSPKGERLLFLDLFTLNLNVFDLRSQTMTRLTRDRSEFYGIWAPDGEEIIHNRYYRNSYRMYQLKASGSGTPLEIMSKSNPIIGADWSNDGRVLMYTETDPKTLSDIKFHFPDQEKEDLMLTPNRASQDLARLSPATRYVAYTSVESGQSEVYVQPFPPNGDRWTISSEGGEEPIWSPKSDKLYYRNGSDWMEVPVTLEPAFSAGTPTLLFNGPYINVPGYSYDITPDGQRFLLLKPVSSARTATRLKVIKNWFEEVKRLAPVE